MIEKDTWLEDLIWCPSQIEYYFDDPKSGKSYVVYLRWRHCDPWSSELCEIDDCGDWIWPKKSFIENEEYLAEEYKDLEAACVKKLRKMFPHIDFNDPELD